MKIHHVGYLVKKISKAIEKFGILGFEKEGGITRDEIRKIDIQFIKKDGYRVELVSPYADDSVVSELIKRYKNSPYHICYQCGPGTFETCIKDLMDCGFTMYKDACVAPAIENHKVVFLISGVIGIVELIDG